MDPTSRGIAIPLPLTPQEGWVLLILLALVVLSGAIWLILSDHKPTGATDEPGWIRAIKALAIALSPVWLLLLGLSLFLIYPLWLAFAEALRPKSSWLAWLGFSGTDLRWYALAFVGVLTALGALAAAPLALIRVFATERQTRVAEQGHVTDQINKAVAGLGAEKAVKRRMTGEAGEPLSDGDGKPAFEEITVPNIEVPVGAIYALERIAQDSMKYDRGRDHVQIMEIPCAYVRENAPASGAEEFPEPEWEPMKDEATEEERAAHEKKRSERFGEFVLSMAWAWARTLNAHTDTQAAIQVLGRRTAEQVAHERADRRYGPEGFRLDLRNTNLQAVDASRATLDRARLEGADLGRARLEGANPWGARLEGADLGRARLEGAHLGRARLEGADLFGARFDEETNFTAAVLQYAAVKYCDLSKSNVTQDQVNAMFGDGSVALPKGLTRPVHWPTGELDWGVFDEEWRKWRASPESYDPPEPES